MTTYLTGYNGATRTRDQLLSWSQWLKADPEFARRLLALMDASITAGRPVGVGSIFRSFQQQLDLFLTRHVETTKSLACCSWQGKFYKLRPGMAHAAPPGRSYHEATTPQGLALAADLIGDLTFVKVNAAKYGLKEFSAVNDEPWHVQPAEVPNSRAQYVPSKMSPLKRFALPGFPSPAPAKVFAPQPVLKQGANNNLTQVRLLQATLNFWGWRDAYGKVLLVDGDYGAKTAQAVISMQRALKLTADGVYGTVTATALQRFLDGMAALRLG